MKKGLLTAAAITAVGAGGLVTAGASASISEDMRANLATKLGVSEEQVDEAFTELKEERKAEHEVEQQAHLQEQVEAGTITEDQLNALNEFRESLEAEREELKTQDLSREEMREKRDEMRERFEAFAQEQEIDLDALRPERGEGEFGGRRGRHHGRPGNSADSASEAA